ncbi:hypothetical protein VTK73DRAFT_3929 [Phialemonium thermophilum]|uniref:Uncharacterized protein n=1 Tax=Phialemonium thermophilum TaxID=223376 RepID=A0ABR3VD13_9PEZI
MSIRPHRLCVKRTRRARLAIFIVLRRHICPSTDSTSEALYTTDSHIHPELPLPVPVLARATSRAGASRGTCSSRQVGPGKLVRAYLDASPPRMRRCFVAMASSASKPRRFAPLKAGAAASPGVPKLQGVVFDVDGTLW